MPDPPEDSVEAFIDLVARWLRAVVAWGVWERDANARSAAGRLSSDRTDMMNYLGLSGAVNDEWGDVWLRADAYPPDTRNQLRNILAAQRDMAVKFGLCGFPPESGLVNELVAPLDDDGDVKTLRGLLDAWSIGPPRRAASPEPEPSPERNKAGLVIPIILHGSHVEGAEVQTPDGWVHADLTPERFDALKAMLDVVDNKRPVLRTRDLKDLVISRDVIRGMRDDKILKHAVNEPGGKGHGYGIALKRQPH